jgi:hypothetical protein
MRSTRPLPLLCLAWLALTLPFAVGTARGEPAAALADSQLALAIPGAIEFYNTHAQDSLVGLSPGQLQSLLSGEVVVIRRKEGRHGGSDQVTHRVFGYFVISQPMRSVWLSGIDPEYAHNDTYTLQRYANDGKGGSTDYVYIHAPWPVKDRQTVVTARNELDLAKVSQGWIWAQSWDIAPDEKRIAKVLVSSGKHDAVTREMMEQAIWVPTNYGAYICFKLDENRTLLAWTVATSVGGWIPDELVAAFAATQVKAVLKQVAGRSSWIEAAYNKKDEVVYGGDGVVLKKLPATP